MHTYQSSVQNGILVHAASVGEINAVKPLLIKLLNNDRSLRIVLTTNTLAGYQLGSQIHPKIECHLAPLDFLHLRLKQLSRQAPKLIIIVETEIWLNLLFAAKLNGIKVVFVNARMSEKTLTKLNLIKPLIQYVTKSLVMVCCQSEEHRARFDILLGCKAKTCGNLKYAVDLPAFDEANLRSGFGYQQNDDIICFGSSRPGEEKLILKCFDEIKEKYPEIKLILAPRHLNRMDEILMLLRGYRFSRHSKSEKADQIHIFDTIGDLCKAYAICDIAIVGGSFYDFGGHNPLEPAFYAKPIIIGTFHQSCRDSVRKLQSKQGVLVSDPLKLISDIEMLLANKDLRHETGLRAKAVLDANANALNVHFEYVAEHLEYK